MRCAVMNVAAEHRPSKGFLHVFNIIPVRMISNLTQLKYEYIITLIMRLSFSLTPTIYNEATKYVLFSQTECD